MNGFGMKNAKQGGEVGHGSDSYLDFILAATAPLLNWSQVVLWVNCRPI